MRIIGGKDYYDSAAAYGFDPHIIFKRDSTQMCNRDADRVIERLFRGPYRHEVGYHDGLDISGGKRYWHYSAHETAVLFCGTLYRGVSISAYTQSLPYGRDDCVLWTPEALERYSEEHEGLEIKPRFLGDPLFSHRELQGDARDAMIELGIAIATPTGKEFMNRNFREKSGFGDGNSRWVANSDALSEFHFQKFIPPVQAFQQLSQWVGGTLAATHPREIVEIKDDLIKAAKHGMDHTSFRRPPTKKRRKA